MQQPYQQQSYHQQQPQYQQPQYQQQQYQQQQPSYQQQQQRMQIPSYVDDPNDTSIAMLRNKSEQQIPHKKIKKKIKKINKYKNKKMTNTKDNDGSNNLYIINNNEYDKKYIYTLLKNSLLIFVIYFILSQNFINQSVGKIIPNVINNKNLNDQLFLGFIFILLFIILSLIFKI